jgi:hypothetical protein
VAEPRRVSQTLIKRAEINPHREREQAGFHAELPGWDLPTLLQMACARGDRACVEVRCAHEHGHIFMAEGRLVHASVGTVVGEAAVALMLCWPGGNFALCERPWPLKATIDASAEVVLLRAAQAQDERAHAAELAQLGARSLAPVSHAMAREGPVIASVRIDMNGEVVSHNGPSDSIAPLVAYVTRMGALLGPQLGLEPFEALAAELGKRRALVFVEGDEMVGLLLPAGALCQELRQQLGL